MVSSIQSIGQILNALPAGTFKTLGKVRPSGSLQARRQASGAVAFYWRYTIGSKSERVHIGLYDSAAPPKSLASTSRGFSHAAAVRAAEELAIEHSSHKATGGRPALQAAQRHAKQAVDDAVEQAGKHTLGHLLNHYADYLEREGRSSHRDVRSIFSLHVNQAWPDVAALPAKEVTGEQIGDMMRRLFDAGKGRTSNKLRSYLRAAYQTARAARSKGTIPEHFKGYGITHNPASDTEPDERQNRADNDPLLEADLCQYWKNIEHLAGFKGAVLRLHLLTGGQRIEQLVRLKTENIFPDHILLFDGKGRAARQRRHHVPLHSKAMAALAACEPNGIYALSTDGGASHLAATTLSKWAKDAGAGLVAFKAKRIRSGVETLLAKMGISSEVRGRLQSHGISGVQARHYNAHDYLPEKLLALSSLHTRLAQCPALQINDRSR